MNKKIEEVNQQAAAFMKQTMPYADKQQADRYDSVKLALTTLTDRQQTSVVEACFKFYGFQIIGTGGGCSAFETDYEVGDGQMVLMITDANCGTPETIDDDVLVGPHYPMDPEFGIKEGDGVEIDGEYAYVQPDNWIDCLALITQDWMVLTVVEEQIIKTKAGEAIVDLANLGDILEGFVTFVRQIKPESNRFHFESEVKDGVMFIRLYGPVFDLEGRTLSVWTVQADRQNLAFFHHCGSGSKHLVQNFDLDDFVNNDSLPIFEEIERHLTEHAAHAIISRSEYEAREGLTTSWQKKQESMTLSDNDGVMFDNAVMDCFRRIVKDERSIHFDLPRKVDGMLTFSCKGLLVDEFAFELVVDCNVDEDRRPDSCERWILNAMRRDNGWTEGSSFMLNDEEANDVSAFDLAEWIFETMNAWRIAKELLATVFASLKAGSFNFLPDPRGRHWSAERFGSKISAVWINDDSFKHSLLLNGSKADSKIQSTSVIRIRQGCAVDVIQDVMDFCHHMIN